MEIKTIIGDFASLSVYNNHDCLLYDLDATSVQMCKIVQGLWDRYPYARLHRENFPYKNRAVVSYRSNPGSIHIGEPPEFNNRMDEDPHLPLIIGLVTQFASRPATLPAYENPPCEVRSLDEHFYDGLEKDTEYQRWRWFENALKEALVFILKRCVKRIIIPYGFGMSSYLDNCAVWESKYLPILEKIGQKLRKRGIVLFIVRPENIVPPQSSTHGIFENKIPYIAVLQNGSTTNATDAARTPEDDATPATADASSPSINTKLSDTINSTPVNVTTSVDTNVTMCVSSSFTNLEEKMDWE